MRETLDGFLSGLQIGRRIVTNLRYADDIILLATLEAELQELVDRLDRVSRKYSLFINVGKTKVIASDGIACHIRLAHFGRHQQRQLESQPAGIVFCLVSNARFLHFPSAKFYDI